MACCLPVADLAVRISGCPAARRATRSARRPAATARPLPRARPAAAPVRGEGTIAAIKVEGNQRIETGTILSYMLVQPGDPFDPDRLDRSLKTLYATGLFQDVRLNRDGDTLVVRVVENPLVNRVAFEGNHKLTDDQLRPEMQLRPRAVFTPALAEQDRQHILDLYAKRGYYNARVDPQVIRLDQNRVDVVFQINDGSVTLISKIVFVGNHEFSEDRLTEVINSREERWWRFLSSSDEYDPQRLNFDKELLRRFYLKNGYVDFEVTDAKAELAPDRSGFFLTFTISEGERYRVGKITINSQLRNLTGDDLRRDLADQRGRLVRRRRRRPQRRRDGTGRSQPRLRVRRGEAADRPRPREAHRRSRVRCRRGPARLCRANRHRRQHAHQGQGDPPRVPSGRRRRVQCRGGAPVAGAAAEPQLLQQRQDRAPRRDRRRTRRC